MIMLSLTEGHTVLWASEKIFMNANQNESFQIAHRPNFNLVFCF